MADVSLGSVGRLSRSIVRHFGILVVLLVFGAIVAATNPAFLTVRNLLDMGQQWSSFGIMAVAMTFVLIGGGFDLSVGGTYACAATLAAALTQRGDPAPVVTVAVLAVGLLVGVVNGILITKMGVNALVATLGSGQIITGLTLVYSQGNAYNVSGGAFVVLGAGYVGAVPVALIVLLGIGVLAAIVLGRSNYGRSLYATGGNPQAAYLSGIRVDAVRIATYVFSGAAAALAGIVYVGRVSSGQGNIGSGVELTVIAAVLIGGTSIAGGEGALWRSATGVALLAVLQNFFDQSSMNSFWQYVVQGAVIIGAVAFESLSKRKRRSVLRVLLGASRLRTAAPDLAMASDALGTPPTADLDLGRQEARQSS